MSANTTYYVKVPKLLWQWIEVDALVAADVWEKHPQAMEVLHWTEYEDLAEDEK